MLPIGKREANGLASHQCNLTNERKILSYECTKIGKNSKDRLDQYSAQLDRLSVLLQDQQACQRLFISAGRLHHEIVQKVRMTVKRYKPSNDCGKVSQDQVGGTTFPQHSSIC